MKRYYQILGISEGATKSDIKKAYRKMALKYHPDVNKGPGAEAKFLSILEAYEYLIGIRKIKQNRKGPMPTDESDKVYEAARKAAEAKAKAQYRERVRKFRAEQEKKQTAEYQKATFILVGIVVLALAIWQGYRFLNSLMINNNPVVVQATVVDLEMKRMIYRFPVGDKTVTERMYVSNLGAEMLTATGLPIKIGDSFELTYSYGYPQFHKVNFERVSTHTMKNYVVATTKSLEQIYSHDWAHLGEQDKIERAACITFHVFDIYGYSGLANIIYHDVNLLENFSNNSWKWNRMIEDEKYKSILDSCSTFSAH